MIIKSFFINYLIDVVSPVVVVISVVVEGREVEDDPVVVTGVLKQMNLAS